MSAQPPAAEPGAALHDLVFLYDVDNTLLDNDQLKQDADTQLEQLLGPQWSDIFWQIYEDVRHQEDVVDIPEAMRRFAAQCPDQAICAGVHAVFDHPDFRHYLYPGALPALEHTGRLGTNVVVSDGDPVFQRAKIERSGIAAAAGNVLIYIHKEQHADEIQARFPAQRYVLIDDKPRILKAMRPLFDARLLTIFVCQGHYAHDPAGRADLHPDLTLAAIGDLVHYSAAEFASGQFQQQGSCM